MEHAGKDNRAHPANLSLSRFEDGANCYKYQSTLETLHATRARKIALDAHIVLLDRSRSCACCTSNWQVCQSALYG